MKTMQLARLGPREQTRPDQRREVLLPQLGFGQFRQHGEPLEQMVRDLSLATEQPVRPLLLYCKRSMRTECFGPLEFSSFFPRNNFPGGPIFFQADYARFRPDRIDELDDDPVHTTALFLKCILRQGLVRGVARHVARSSLLCSSYAGLPIRDSKCRANFSQALAFVVPGQQRPASPIIPKF